MKKKIITQTELNKINKYWWQMGGFGGMLKSGIWYHSETSCFGRVMVLNFWSKDDDDIEDLDLTVFEGDTVKEIEERLTAELNERGLTLTKQFNLIKNNLGDNYE